MRPMLRWLKRFRAWDIVGCPGCGGRSFFKTTRVRYAAVCRRCGMRGTVEADRPEPPPLPRRATAEQQIEHHLAKSHAHHRRMRKRAGRA